MFLNCLTKYILSITSNKTISGSSLSSINSLFVVQCMKLLDLVYHFILKMIVNQQRMTSLKSTYQLISDQ